MIPMVSPNEVGLLGELRLEFQRFGNALRPFMTFLAPLVLKRGGIIISRSPDYYQPLTLSQAIEDALCCSAKGESLECWDTYIILAQYIILDRVLNRLGRVAHTALLESRRFYPSAIRLYEWAIGNLELCAHRVVALMKGCSDCKKPISLSLPSPVPSSMRSLQVRTVIEMDNLPLIFWRAASLEELLQPNTGVISPLLGGALVPPMLAALHTKTKWAYVSASLYENKANREILIPGGGSLPPKVVLIDDNIGSGETLRLIRKRLENEGISVLGIASIEMHWEKFFNVQSGIVAGKTFSLDAIDNLSPFAYRHYLEMKRLYEQYYSCQTLDSRTLRDWMLWSQQLLRQIRDASWLPNSDKFRITKLLELFNDVRWIFGSQ